MLDKFATDPHTFCIRVVTQELGWSYVCIFECPVPSNSAEPALPATPVLLPSSDETEKKPNYLF